MKKTIHLLGDSLVKAYGSDENNFIGGWGDHLQAFFDKSKIEVIDYAMGGRSTRSFINEGRFIDNGNFTTEQEPLGLGPALSKIKKGDYVFIQFGHNDDSTKEKLTLIDRMVPLGNPDEKGIYPVIVPCEEMKTTTKEIFSDYIDIMKAEGFSDAQIELNKKKYKDILPSYGESYYSYFCGATYKGYLKYYLDCVKNAGAIPVIVTSIARVNMKNGKLNPVAGHHGGYDEFGAFPYITAARQIAKEEGVKLFDLFEKSRQLYELLGDEDSIFLQSIKDKAGQTIGEANYDRPAKWVEEYDKYMEEKSYSAIDRTHQNRFGSFLFAGFIAEYILEQKKDFIDLKKFMYTRPQKILKRPKGIEHRMEEIRLLYKIITI